METATETTTPFDVFFSSDHNGYVIRDNSTNELVTNSMGTVRTFSTTNSARKAVTRLRRPAGDRHR